MANLTGPEHYRQAEELLKQASDQSKQRTEGERTRMLAEAQVHATLALVAASVYGGGFAKDDIKRWDEKGVWMR